MGLHDKNDLTENKLILLYLHRKMGMMLPLGHAVEFIVKKDWMNYFDLHQHMHDLCEAGFVSKQTDGYLITASGISVADEFKKRIPFSIREAIDQYVQEQKKDIQTQMQIISDYSQDSSSEFPVTLQIHEHQIQIFSLRLVASSREEAERLCKAFDKNAAQLYADMISNLAREI